MRKVAFVLMFGLAFSTYAAQDKDLSEVDAIFERYLESIHPKGPSKTDAHDSEAAVELNRARIARLSILAELKAFPEETVLAARHVLFDQANPKQRYEIVGMLGDGIHTSECADLLHDVIQDLRKPSDENAAFYEELARSSAVHGLRMMGRRTDRRGGKRIQMGPDFEPKVSGLVPYMISAANDKAERVRVSALYALAGSRDPAAEAELLNRLKDPSEKVRLYAACFLTEYQNAAGLPELRKALVRLKNTTPDVESEVQYYAGVQQLLVSFERITGKSFGEVPLNPFILSYAQDRAREQFKELMDTWHTWWTWQPDKEGQSNS